MASRTKQILASALKESLSKRPIEKITVTEIVEQCDVNRQTFYYHFKDIYDLLGWIYRSEAVGSIRNKRSYHTWQQGLEDILCYVKDNKDMCYNTYRSLGKDHLEMFLDEVLFELLGDVLDEVDDQHRLQIEDRQFILQFFCHAFTGTLLDWIADGYTTPVEALAQMIERIMDQQFGLMVERFTRLENE